MCVMEFLIDVVIKLVVVKGKENDVKLLLVMLIDGMMIGEKVFVGGNVLVLVLVNF